MLPRRSGKVINIASIQGLTGCYPDGVPTLAYNAGKGAVVNMTRTLANEWALASVPVMRARRTAVAVALRVYVATRPQPSDEPQPSAEPAQAKGLLTSLAGRGQPAGNVITVLGQ